MDTRQVNKRTSRQTDRQADKRSQLCESLAESISVIKGRSSVSNSSQYCVHPHNLITYVTGQGNKKSLN